MASNVTPAAVSHLQSAADTDCSALLPALLFFSDLQNIMDVFFIYKSHHKM